MAVRMNDARRSLHNDSGRGDARCISRSRCFQLLEWHFIEQQAVDVSVLAGVLHVYPNQPTFFVKIQHDSFCDFSAFSAGAIIEMNVERIGSGIIRQSYGLNLLSGKALWSVTPTSRVATRK